MPIIKSAKKALRQNKQRRTRNVAQMKLMKGAIKNVSEDTLAKVYALIDKAVKNHLIPKNKAARLKSRAAKFVLKTTKKVGATIRAVASNKKPTRK